VTAECHEPLAPASGGMMGAAVWRSTRDIAATLQSKREHRRSFHAEASTMDGIVYRTTLLHIHGHACL
jgi:hypothetical protein